MEINIGRYGYKLSCLHLMNDKTYRVNIGELRKIGCKRQFVRFPASLIYVNIGVRSGKRASIA